MNELKALVDGTLATIMIKTKSSEDQKLADEIENKLWDIAEKAMIVQQQICGGHK
jgi:hypothetical protein